MPVPKINRPIPRFKRPFGTRPGGVAKPELRPVKPKVPGTRDRNRPPRATTDPSISELRKERVRLDAERDRIESDNDFILKPRKRERHRKLVARRAEVREKLA